MPRRDSKGRVAKALAKSRKHIPTDIKLERKLAKIERTACSMRYAGIVLLLNALLIAGCSALVAAGPIVGSIPACVTGAIGIFVRVGSLREANANYWKFRARHRRLLRDADTLTNKLLLEEGVDIDTL